MNENDEKNKLEDNEENLEKETQEELIPIDATVFLEINANSTEASIIISPPENKGRHISKDKIYTELQTHGVTYGINENLIATIVLKRQYNIKHIIAKYLPPVDGQNGTISYLYDTKKVMRPKENDDGTVNYKDLGLIRNIKKGDIIANIAHPTKCEPGINIKNEEITPVPGEKAHFVLGENTALNESTTSIVATVDGNITFNKGCFNIEPNVIIDNDIDASIGNIDFIGSIIIKGDVLEGFSVKADKGITIHGTVTGAKLFSFGNIVVKKGVLHSELSTNGNATLGFCENSKITCDGNLTSQVFTFCDVYCKKKLSTIGNQGIIAGGKYIALETIEANVLGSKAYTKTDITLGDNAVMYAELERLRRKVVEMDENINKCALIVNFLNEKRKQLGRIPPEREEMLSNSVKTKIILQKDKINLQHKISEIEEKLSVKQHLEIQCRREAYPGVTIKINDYVYHVQSIVSRCKFYLTEDATIGIKNLI